MKSIAFDLSPIEYDSFENDNIQKKKSWKGKLFIQMLKKNNDNVYCLLSGRLAVTVFFSISIETLF